MASSVGSISWRDSFIGWWRPRIVGEFNENNGERVLVVELMDSEVVMFGLGVAMGMEVVTGTVLLVLT